MMSAGDFTGRFKVRQIQARCMIPALRAGLHFLLLLHSFCSYRANPLPPLPGALFCTFRVSGLRYTFFQFEPKFNIRNFTSSYPFTNKVGEFSTSAMFVLTMRRNISLSARLYVLISLFGCDCKSGGKISVQEYNFSMKSLSKLKATQTYFIYLIGKVNGNQNFSSPGWCVF